MAARLARLKWMQGCRGGEYGSHPRERGTSRAPGSLHQDARSCALRSTVLRFTLSRSAFPRKALAFCGYP